MPMQRTTLRWTTAVHDMVAERASAEGTSVAQYVREATLMRVAFELGGSQDLRTARAELLELIRSRGLAGE